MRTRTRKLIGTAVLITFVTFYALVAMALAEGRILSAPYPVQVVVYIILGIAWIFPCMPLIRWMEKPDPQG